MRQLITGLLGVIVAILVVIGLAYGANFVSNDYANAFFIVTVVIILGLGYVISRFSRIPQGRWASRGAKVLAGCVALVVMTIALFGGIGLMVNLAPHSGGLEGAVGFLGLILFGAYIDAIIVITRLAFRAPLLSDQPAGIVTAALSSADTVRPPAPTLGNANDVNYLMSTLKDPDPQMRIAAALALLKLRDPRAVDPLIASLQDPDQSVRMNVEAALAVFVREVNFPDKPEAERALREYKTAH